MVYLSFILIINVKILIELLSLGKGSSQVCFQIGRSYWALIWAHFKNSKRQYVEFIDYIILAKNHINWISITTWSNIFLSKFILKIILVVNKKVIWSNSYQYPIKMIFYRYSVLDEFYILNYLKHWKWAWIKAHHSPINPSNPMTN